MHLFASLSEFGNFLQLFNAAAIVLEKIGEDFRIIQKFTDLGNKAKDAAYEAMDAEATLGDIPDEFLDPIQVCCVFLHLLYVQVDGFQSLFWVGGVIDFIMWAKEALGCALGMEWLKESNNRYYVGIKPVKS